MPESDQKEEKKPKFSYKDLIYWALLCIGSTICVINISTWFARQWWVLEMITHFKLQYFLILFITILSLAGLKKHKTPILVFSIFAFINFIELLPFYLPKASHPILKNTRFRIMHINLEVSNDKYDLVGSFIKKNNPDIILLEELSEKWLTNLKETLSKYPYRNQRPDDGCFGIGLFSKLPQENSEIFYFKEDNIPFLHSEYRVGNNSIHIWGIHPEPPGESGLSMIRNKQLAEITEIMKTKDKASILIGDFNISPWSPYFKEITNATELKNSAESFGVQATWPTYYPQLLIPIDLCLHTPDLVVLDRFVGDYTGSDHYPIVVDFALKSRE